MIQYGLTKNRNICGVNTRTNEAKVLSINFNRKKEIIELLDILNDNGVSLYHFEDVVEDYFS